LVAASSDTCSTTMSHKGTTEHLHHHISKQHHMQDSYEAQKLVQYHRAADNIRCFVTT
jgi:hypothetical protein